MITFRITIKIQLLEEAIQNIDKIVSANMYNHEVLFIRANFYSELPDIFGKREIVIEDLKRIICELDNNEDFFKLAAIMLKEVAPEELDDMEPEIKSRIDDAVNLLHRIQLL